MDIVEELRQDRERGARRLESEYKAGLMSLARRLYHDPGDAEELVNRTFAVVVEGIDGFLEQSSFFTWMCQILVKLHANDCRRKSHGIVTYPGEVPGIPDEATEGEVYRELDASLLRDAVERLPADQREAVVLHYFADMPVADIALHPSVVANVAPGAYAIKSGSPCRDKGLTLAGQSDEKDLLGNRRVKYCGVDMGALECAEGLAFTMVIR
ncbi:MAG: sigma-70 family RNA polymerase sigma factor [Kiritimatiellae bacterium]|nr:sigma-70 family RNA polymerase sigma factor [Kiritimatiellia bacterium]